MSRTETADEAALRRELGPLINERWRARLAYEDACARVLRATRAALGIGQATEVVAAPGWEERAEYELLGAPWMRLILCDGRPPVVLCGKTEESCSYRARPGPNGPVDSDRWVKRDGTRVA